MTVFPAGVTQNSSLLESRSWQLGGGGGVGGGCCEGGKVSIDSKVLKAVWTAEMVWAAWSAEMVWSVWSAEAQAVMRAMQAARTAIAERVLADLVIVTGI